MISSVPVPPADPVPKLGAIVLRIDLEPDRADQLSRFTADDSIDDGLAPIVRTLVRPYPFFGRTLLVWVRNVDAER